MKKYLWLLGLGISLNSFAQQRTCNTMDEYTRQLQADPANALRRADLESHTARFVANPSAQQRAVITIPVVVHVLYNTTAQNVSDAQIQSQIDVLNKDFRKLNTDASLVPSAFAGLAADSEIQFCLAKRDPSGATTTGVTRTQTSKTSFLDDNKMKYTAQGGRDAWDRNQYLNLWVCNLGGGLLGYAQFPATGVAATDGVVVNYTAFGTTGTATAPYNKGRTLTHEVGHWLNLFHIWGDDGTACTGSDQVGDTPNQGDENYGCPTYPTASCSNTSDMYMNYMDYTDDACMYMFTAGQKARMQALFATGGARASLATSQGCAAPVATACGTAASMSTTAISASGATLNWAAVTSATSYNVRYKAITATTWVTTTSTTVSKAITGLLAGTSYEFQVQAVCAAAGNFTASSTFTTTAATSTCTDNYEANETRTTSKTIPANTNITAKIGTATDQDWFKITTTTTAKNLRVDLSGLPADYDLYLYNSAGTLLKSSANGSTTAEFVAYNTTVAGTYYINVKGYNSAFSASACYTLKATTSSTAVRTTARLGEEEFTPKQDFNGEVAATEAAIETGLKLYPNPARTNLSIEYITNMTQEVNMNIYDMLGRKITSFVQTAYEGDNTYQISVETLPKGMHLLEVVDAEGRSRQVQKFMIE